jgi:hypothetical protein
LFGQFNCFGEGLRPRCRHDWNALRNHFNGNSYQFGSLVARETAGFAGCSANDNSVRAFANLTLCQFGELPQIELAVPERRQQRRIGATQKFPIERHHKKITFPAAQVSSTRGPKIKARYAARLVEKPSFAPRDSMGWSRLSCQSKEPIQMFNGLSWIVNS